MHMFGGSSLLESVEQLESEAAVATLISTPFPPTTEPLTIIPTADDELQNVTTTTRLQNLSAIAAVKSGHHPAFLALILLNAWTTISNLVVLLVMLRTPSLRRRFGCVMLSLSCSDLACSVFVMPFAIYYYSNTRGWLIGGPLCIGWITADVFFCTASICHHASIAIHRYLAIAKPHQMSMITTNKPILLQLILPSWTVGFCIAMILAIQAFIRQEIVFRDDSCGLHDRLYLIYSSVVSYFIPLSLIILVSLKSIFLLRHHLRLKQEAIYKNKRLTAAVLSKTLSVPSPCQNDQTEEGSTKVLSELVSQIHHIKPHSKGSLKRRKEPEAEFMRALEKEEQKNSMLAMTKRRRALSLQPDQAMDLLKLKGKPPQQETVSRVSAFKSLLESYLELGSYVYGAYYPPNKLVQGSQPTSSSAEETSSNDPGSKRGSVCSSRLGTIDRTEWIKTAPLMEAITEEDNQQPFSPPLVRQDFTPKEDLQRNASTCSFTSDTIYDDQSLQIDLMMPKGDFDSAVISVDEVTPSMDMMTSTGYIIPEIPSPVDEEHPLDLRVVFSRTVPNFQAVTFTPVLNTAKKSNANVVQSPSPNRKSKLRKRAYTINFPIRHVLVQKAPIVQMEGMPSPQPDQRRLSMPFSSSIFTSRSKQSASLLHSENNDNRARSHSHSFAYDESISSSLTLYVNAVAQSPPHRRNSQKRSRPMRTARRSRPSIDKNHFRFRSPSVGSNVRSSFAVGDVKIFTNSEDGLEQIEDSGLDSGNGSGAAQEQPQEQQQPQIHEPKSSPDKLLDKMPIANRASLSLLLTTDTGSITELNELGINETRRFSARLRSSLSSTSIDAVNIDNDGSQGERLGRVSLVPSNNNMLMVPSPTSSAKKVPDQEDVSNDDSPASPISPASMNAPSPLAVTPPEETRSSWTHYNSHKRMNIHGKKRAFLQTATVRMRQREKERQAERVLLFVLFVFVCMWLPFFTTNFLYGVCPSCVYEGVYLVFTWCGWCSSAINPIVYTFFNRDFKRAFVRLVCGDKHRQKSMKRLATGIIRKSVAVERPSVQAGGSGGDASLIAAPFAVRHIRRPSIEQSTTYA